MISWFSSTALGQLSDALGGGVGSITVLDFTPMVDALARLRAESTRWLSDLSDALRNPGSVAADEIYRRGILAVEHGWYEEAERELSASIERFPYRPAAQFALGYLYLDTDRPALALAPFRLAVRYGTAAEPEFAVSAALMAADIYNCVGHADEAAALLNSARDTLPACSTVLYAIADHTRDLESAIDASMFEPISVLDLPDEYLYRNDVIAATTDSFFRRAVEANNRFPAGYSRAILPERVSTLAEAITVVEAVIGRQDAAFGQPTVTTPDADYRQQPETLHELLRPRGLQPASRWRYTRAKPC